MTAIIPSVTLPRGGEMPRLGFGTYKVDPAEAKAAVANALAAGYRHIDTAQMYGNEAEVGEAIAESGIDRSEIFLTTKLNNPNHEPADVRASFEASLEALRTDYVDLFLIHWPLPTLYGGDIALPWPTMCELYEEGRAREIGLSNFLPEHIDAILQVGGVRPAINQVEAHPYFPNNEVREGSRDRGLLTQAWSPLGRGTVLDDPIIQDIAEDRNATPAQIVLAWHLQRGDTVFPKSVSRQRMEENLDIFGVHLKSEDLAAIDQLDRGEAGRRGSDPATMDRL